MKTAFIIVYFNTPESEKTRIIKEIQNIGLSDNSIITIDNTGTNRGYANGINKALKKLKNSSIDLFFICNPDISFKDNTKSMLLKAIKKFDVWGYAMKQNNTIYYGGELDQKRLSGGLITQKPKTQFNTVDFISGSLMVIKKEVINTIGNFREIYHMYYEDVDYCIRAKKAGFRIGIDTNVLYHHMESSDINNPEKKICLAKNRLRILLQYGSLKQKLFELLYIPKTIHEFILLYFQKRTFVKNFFSLNISSVFNKFLHFIFFLILIKTLHPETYGIYSFIWTHVGILGSFLDFGTTNVGLMQQHQYQKDEFQYILLLRIVIGLFVYIGTIVASIIFAYKIELIIYIAIVALHLLASSTSGSYLILKSVQNQSDKPAIVSIVFNIIYTVILSSVTIITKNILLIFITIGILYVGYCLFNLFLILKSSINLTFQKPNFYILKWRSIIQKSYIFVLISFFAGLYFKVDIFLLKMIQGSRDVGIYTAGLKFLDGFMFLVASYNIVSLPFYSQLLVKSPQTLLIKMKKDLKALFILGGSIALFSSIVSPFILQIIMNKSYTSSISVFQIVIFALPLILLSSVFINVLYVLKKSHLILFLFIFQLIFNLVLNILFIPLYSYYASAYITVVCEIINTVSTALLFLFIYKKITKNENST